MQDAHRKSSCSGNSRYAGLPNTVSQFSPDNNGVLLSLPVLPAAGSNAPVVGSLIFGVATQSNNTPAETALAVANSVSQGTFSTKVGNQWFSAYIDSGTDVLHFNDSADTALTACPSSGNFDGWYCPHAT